MRAIVVAILAAFVACAAAPLKVPPEPVAWQVCYDSTGTVTSWTGECTDPSVIAWKLPIVVYIDDSFPRPELALQALFWWNDTVGIKLFDTSLDKNEASVMLMSNNLTVPVGAGAVADHWVHPVYGRLFVVNVWSLQSDDLTTLVHEFGHVLGLAHDPVGIGLSVMQPKPYMDHFVLSPKDLTFLKMLYEK